MFQLNFYPHLDLHHTAFRALCIGSDFTSLTIDGYRLIDFFLTFPFELRIIRSRGTKLKKISEEFENHRPYKWSSDPTYTFLQMSEFQNIAIKALSRKMILSPDTLELGKFRAKVGYEVSDNLRLLINAFLNERRPVLDALQEIIQTHGITGKNGLKARSGLMPYKYDVDDNVVLD